MIAVILIGAFFISAAIYTQKKRRAFLEHGIELQGEVMFFEKRRGWKGQKNYPYYVLQVRANGQDYYIETDNSKARKYKNRTDVTILTLPELELPQLPAGQPADILQMQQEMQQKLDAVNQTTRTRMTILKEEMPSLASVWVPGIFGVLLILLAAVSIFGPLITGK